MGSALKMAKPGSIHERSIKTVYLDWQGVTHRVRLRPNGKITVCHRWSSYYYWRRAKREVADRLRARFQEMELT